MGIFPDKYVQNLGCKFENREFCVFFCKNNFSIVENRKIVCIYINGSVHMNLYIKERIFQKGRISINFIFEWNKLGRKSAYRQHKIYLCCLKTRVERHPKSVTSQLLMIRNNI